MSDQMPAKGVVFQNQIDNLNFQIEPLQDQFLEKNQAALKLIYPEQQNRVHLSNDHIEIILKGCRLNQRAAQKKLYRNYFSYTMSLALRYSSSYDDAVERTNEAFLKIYRDLKNLVLRYDDTLTSFTEWLKKVVVNTCIDHIKKYDQKDGLPGADTGRTEIAVEPGPTGEMLQHKEIIRCIQQLSPHYRAVFNLYAIEGFSHAEIADKLNISESTSKSNLDKARQNLQQLLKESNIINYERTL